MCERERDNVVATYTEKKFPVARYHYATTLPQPNDHHVTEQVRRFQDYVPAYVPSPMGHNHHNGRRRSSRRQRCWPRHCVNWRYTCTPHTGCEPLRHPILLPLFRLQRTGSLLRADHRTHMVSAGWSGGSVGRVTMVEVVLMVATTYSSSIVVVFSLAAIVLTCGRRGVDTV